MRIKLIVLLALLSFIITGCSSKSSLDNIKIIDLKSGSKHLLFYGSMHSNDKKEPMYKDIEEKFKDLNPQMVLVEGYQNKFEYQNADKAILNGESAYVSYMAKKDNIALDTNEPPIEEQYKSILAKYDKEKVLSMYILRQIYQYQNQQKELQGKIQQLLPQFVQYMKEKESFPIDESQTKFEYIQKILKPYLKIDINEDNWAKLDVHSIVYEKSEINDVYNEVYNQRNEYLLSIIKKSLEKYDRVFVIMGSQHAIDEERNIREMFSKLRN